MDKQQTTPDTTTETRTRFRPPPLYDVIMYNDNVTPMEFVVLVLVDVFELERSKAVKVMLDIHHSTSRVVATYPKSVAEFKLSQCEELKKHYGCLTFRVAIRPQSQEGDNP
ncbi:MAG: ATP-dependent Clp protease adaptor ClpS [Victivallales bacterium]|nr:ATP-dependent Clp protease adaptor ClpS [Victivallales bacterium]